MREYSGEGSEENTYREGPKLFRDELSGCDKNVGRMCVVKNNSNEVTNRNE